MPLFNNFRQFDLNTPDSAKAFCQKVKIKCNRLLVSYLTIITCTILLAFSINVQAKSSRVVMYGDSISAGYGMTLAESWPHLLNETFIAEGRDIELINESISGETTGGGLARINNVIKRQNLGPEDWVIIELGGNDGLRGFPIKTIKQNLNAMVAILKSHKINVAIMQIRIPPNYGNRYTKMFENLFEEVAKENDIQHLPFFMDTIAINPNYMLQDGIHPNKSAQVIIRDIMAPVISQLVKGPK